MDKYDPERLSALRGRRGCGWPAAGTQEGFLQQQNSMRDAIIAALNFNIFARHADRARRQHRADGQRAAGADFSPTATGCCHADLPIPKGICRSRTRLCCQCVRSRRIPPGRLVRRASMRFAVRASDGKLCGCRWSTSIRTAGRHTAWRPEMRASAASGHGADRAGGQFDQHLRGTDTVAPRPISARAAGGRGPVQIPAKSVVMLAIEQ